MEFFDLKSRRGRDARAGRERVYVIAWQKQLP